MASFGRYELLSRLGAGGMGEVFLARAGAAGEVVVLKRVLPHLAADEAFRESFLEEARIAARLSHPNIVRIFELGDVGGQWFIAMEYVAGADLVRLAEASRAQGRELPVELACRIVEQAAAALEYAHGARDAQGRSLKIVHRDVSPHNLLVGFDGVVKLIDFGIARAVRRLEHTGIQPAGKYAWMSPEQLAGDEVDARSDQFSLGVVFWELLAGRQLFDGESDLEILQRVEACEVPRPSAVRPGVPAEVEAVVLKMLSKRPAERFAGCGEVRTELEAWLGARGEGRSAQLSAWMRELFPGRGSGDAVATVREPAARPSTSFVGRGRELAELRDLLSRVGRVELVGSPGIGKTRLALEVAGSTGATVTEDVDPPRTVVVGSASSGEQRYDVPPLAEAAELFLDRAPGTDLRSAEELVERLSRAPLSIELVAARFPAVPPSGGLEDVIGWSWGLLPAHEQSALAQLSVFPSRFSMESVEAVIDLAGFPGAPWPLDVLQSLKEAALVQVWESGAGVEFSLHGSVRAFAREQLRAQGAVQAAVLTRYSALRSA